MEGRENTELLFNFKFEINRILNNHSLDSEDKICRINNLISPIKPPQTF